MNGGSRIAGRPACQTIAAGRAFHASSDAPNCAVAWTEEVRGATITTVPAMASAAEFFENKATPQITIRDAASGEWMRPALYCAARRRR